MNRRLLLRLTVVFLLAGCAAPRIPISEINIPKLDVSKSRVYFYYGGRPIYPITPKIIQNYNILALFNRWSDCTFIDFEPGNYQFKAGHNSLGPVEMVTDILLEANKTYYLEWSWTRDHIFGPFHGSMRGARLIPVERKEGENKTKRCFFVKPEPPSLPEQRDEFE